MGADAYSLFFFHFRTLPCCGVGPDKHCTQLAAQVTGELYDIRAKLYRDENCFEETHPLILCAPYFLPLESKKLLDIHLDIFFP